jgi:hypothetical protein
MQFMYYARGMNFNDMLKLKWTDFQNNGIVYKRSKNKRNYNFELHSKALKVVKLLKDYSAQSREQSDGKNLLLLTHYAMDLPAI